MNIAKFPTLIGLLFACTWTLACGDGGSETAMPNLESSSGPTGSALVSDWLNRRLDLIDLSKLQEGADRDTALLQSLDLSAYEQAPINAEVSPDGKLALVSLSDGFFAIPGAGLLVGAATVPSGPGRVLAIDIATMSVTGEILTGDGPMGIAFVANGTRAVIPHFGQDTMTLVDLATLSVVEDIPVGIYAEEIALDDTGSVGIFSYSAAGNVRTFASDDVAGSLSDGLELTGDAAGVAFFPGTKTAYVVQAPNPLIGAMGGHTIVDVTTPSDPVVLEDVRDPMAPVAYPAAPAPARGTVVVPVSSGGMMALLEIALTADGKRQVTQTIELGMSMTFGAYGAVVDNASRALLSVPGYRQLTVVDLATATSFVVPWGGTEVGPMDVALVQNPAD